MWVHETPQILWGKKSTRISKSKPRVQIKPAIVKMFQYQNRLSVFGIKWYQFRPKQYQVVKKAVHGPIKARV